MPDYGQTLNPAAVQAFYDRFGNKQDKQGFYEDSALDDLTAHAAFQDTQNVFEFGCGTGKFAARLLEDHLSLTAGYFGCDISPVMVGLAKHRLKGYAERAQVALSDGAVQFPLADHSVDCVVSCYVLDLLSEADIWRFFSEAHRTLTPGGRVCLASLTRGVNLPSYIVSSLWAAVFNLRPTIVGGCRPIDLDSFLEKWRWRMVHHRVLTPYGIPSEVLIMEARA